MAGKSTGSKGARPGHGNDGAGTEGERVADFEIRRHRFLDEQGRPVAPLPPLADDRDGLCAIYRHMVLNRQFDARCVTLQRTGQLGTYASALGQEAIMAAVPQAMRDDDVLFPTYRESGALLARGVTMAELFAYWHGEERGMDFSGPRKDFPICITIASHAPHAAGVAASIMLRGEPRVAVCMLGDGATAKGEFYEAMNLAGLWTLPVVFVVNNNQWAISLPRTKTSSAETLAQKAIAAGLPGVQVDGNDALAVRHVVGAAIERARAGGGATVIEALSYRLTDHTTADDASRYRSDAEVSAAWRADPIPRLRNFLAERGWWGKAEEEALIADCRARVESGWAAYQQLPPDSPTAMFDYQFATLPPALAEQREILARESDG